VWGFLRRMPGYQLMLILLVPIIAGIVAMLVIRSGGRGYDIDPVERYCIEASAGEAADTIARAVAMRKALLMPLAGQDDGFAYEELRSALRGVGGFEIVEKDDLGTFEQIVDSITSFVRGLAGGGEVRDVAAEPAVAAAKKAGAPVVIFGKVIKRGTSDRRTSFGVALRAVKVDDGKTLVAKAFTTEVRRSWTSGAYRRVWMRSRSWWGRMLVWIGIVAILPIVAGRVTKPLLQQELNAINAAVLAVFVVLDAFTAWLLLGFAGGGAVLLLVVLAALFGGAYSYLVCNRLADTFA